MIPVECQDLFSKPFLGHVSYLNRTGQIVTFPMWVDYDGDHILISSPVGSRKGRSLRERADVAVSILDPENPGHWLSVSGRVVDFRPDEQLAMADRMAHKYSGRDYPRRTPREVFVIKVDRVSQPGGWDR